MGKVNQLWQDERARESNAVWQQAFNDWCIDNTGGAEPIGAQHDEASAAADAAVVEFEQQRDDSEPDPDRLREDRDERARLEKEDGQ